MISQEKIRTFQKYILEWYHLNQRDLPWRKTREPYFILISEVMSQQTQLSRVVPKYEAWSKRFPTVESLANANISEVLHYWSGLGYNRRALNLKKTAEIISKNFNGNFPQDEKTLLSLPGVGQYTARAVLCFAFDKQIAVVDTNVRKVILTQVLQKENSDSYGLLIHDSSKGNLSDKDIETIAEALLPYGRAYEWNQALMDYAAAVLKKEKISIPKQSKFHGSRRYYRGQILKLLLKKKRVAIKDLGFLIKKDYTVSEEEWLQELVEELTKEGFIVFKNYIISIAS